MLSEGKSTRNSFVLKILTSNLFAINILQTLFANPAPSKLFKGMGEGGYLKKLRVCRNLHPPEPPKTMRLANYFRKKSTGGQVVVSR
jgi:hypothetical protein